MDNLKSQGEALKEKWAKVYTSLVDNPSIIQPYAPYSSPEEINETVDTIVYWLKRIRIPKGFSPAFHLAKGLSGTTLLNTLKYVDALQRAEYNHFPHFLNSLTQLLSSFHSMLVFSEKNQSLKDIGEFQAELSQALSVLNTAQNELNEKNILIEKTISSLAELEKISENVLKKHKEISDTVTDLEEKSELASSTIQELEEFDSQSQAVFQKFENLLKENQELNAQLVKQGEELEKLNMVSIEQQRLITKLLPDAASAGLAGAFGTRVRRLEVAKWLWMGTFIVSVGALGYMAYLLIDDLNTQNLDIWQSFIRRLPLVAPLVWLGWFSAIQYGNTIRVQEDYAFKEATSMAFAGYKDHMDHMANIDLGEANNAMRLLASRTIETLSNDPLRIYQKTDRDASPVQNILSFFKGKKTQE